MELWHHATPFQIFAWCYLLALASAFIPWLNSEVIVLSLAALTPTLAGQVTLVLAATVGQMTGKSTLYCAGRRLVKLPWLLRTTGSWRQKLAERKLGGMTLLLISATLGIPPFYAVSVLAGSLGIGFRSFVAAGTCGRFLHYVALVFAPRLLWQLFH